MKLNHEGACFDNHYEKGKTLLLRTVFFMLLENRQMTTKNVLKKPICDCRLSIEYRVIKKREAKLGL